MILQQNEETGFWTDVYENGEPTYRLRTHSEGACTGRLCDVHNRRGTGVQATWPLNWREDRGIMEVLCPCGIGHPTPAQRIYTDEAEMFHGCCGCCYDYESEV